MTLYTGAYFSAKTCVGKAQESAVHMTAFLTGRFPEMRNGGIYGCRTIAGSNTLSTHATGRTEDTMTGTGKPTRNSLIITEQMRVFSKELKIQGIIHNHRDCWAYEGMVWNDYHGQNPHEDHIHTEHWANTLDLSTIRRVLIGPAVTGNRPTKIYRIGSHGDGVVAVQARLNAHGFKLVKDGIFGPKVDGALRTFQQVMGLTIDGIYGPQCHGRMFNCG